MIITLAEIESGTADRHSADLLDPCIEKYHSHTVVCHTCGVVTMEKEAGQKVEVTGINWWNM